MQPDSRLAGSEDFINNETSKGLTHTSVRRLCRPFENVSNHSFTLHRLGLSYIHQISR